MYLGRNGRLFVIRLGNPLYILIILALLARCSEEMTVGGVHLLRCPNVAPRARFRLLSSRRGKILHFGSAFSLLTLSPVETVGNFMTPGGCARTEGGDISFTFGRRERSSAHNSEVRAA